MSTELILLGFAGLLLVSIIASKASDRLGLPALLLFIAVGMLAGSEGIGGLHFDNPRLANFIGTLALTFILFSGGFSTQWRSIRPVLAPGAMLATLGVLITAGLTGGAAVWIFGLSPLEGLLLGAVVSSTDAAAVFAILRSKKVSLKPSLKSLLELESGGNDPMAVFLVVSLIGMMIVPYYSASGFALMFLLQMGLGLALGLVFGRAAVWLINRINLQYEGLYPVLTLSLVPFIYAATTFLQGSGFLAVYVAGIVIGNADLLHKNPLHRFHDGLSWLMQIVMFIMLGLLVTPSRALGAWDKGLLMAVLLMLVARPAAVYLCLWPTKFTFQEKTLAAWVGLRGAAPIILATFMLIYGIDTADWIFDIVFFVVLLSALLQGLSIPWLSKRLGVDMPGADKKSYPLEWNKIEGVAAELNDVIVPYDGRVVGKHIYEIGLPKDSLIVLISRGDKFMIPGGATVLQGGDVLLVLAEPKDLPAVYNAVG